ncbi:m7GpppN-mRNA hydrolase-like [Macrobrachium nipponense]|uniref:m7GpppN-mRNA hydrolase-like n=1 Tax=Macrobrachium nipponense TaxID=159736 RepID=UPI0030C7BCDF
MLRLLGQVLEETGYDISSVIDPNVFLETSIGEQRVRLYIITGVPMDTEFVPRTKGEIKQLKWFPINQLPSHKNDRYFNKVNGSANMFYMVMPFVKPLREWIANGTKGREGRRRHRSSTNNTSDQNSNHKPSRHNQSPEETPSFERQHSATESPPKRKENTKGKSRKSLFNGFGTVWFGAERGPLHWSLHNNKY